jgi:hypothetical protein
VGVLLDSLNSTPALGPVARDHLLQARQMQALSFTVHIPLVCFGIALPVMVLLMEWSAAHWRPSVSDDRTPVGDHPVRDRRDHRHGDGKAQGDLVSSWLNPTSCVTTRSGAESMPSSLPIGGAHSSPACSPSRRSAFCSATPIRSTAR